MSSVPFPSVDGSCVSRATNVFTVPLLPFLCSTALFSTYNLNQDATFLLGRNLTYRRVYEIPY